MVNDADVVLEFQQVSKHYPGAEHPAVDEIDLVVRRGEFVTFLGPSGSGKTTSLNMIAGFVSPSSGRIVIDGSDICDLPPYRRNLGMVFQNYALFPHMTVWDNVAFPLVERKVPKAEIRRRVAAALELVHLGGLGKRYPRELSGGQQQRVALTRALVFDPPILLMDEPLGALDKKLRDTLQSEIRRVHRELGITFLFVTHDQEEAMALSDTVVVFERGAIQQIGAPDELYRRPRTRFVAEFLGESNLLDGHLERAGDTWLLRTADGAIPLDGWSAPRDVPPGGHCVLFRPEDVRITGPEDSAAVWRAEVREVVYLGSEERIVVSSESGVSLTVRTSGGTAPRRLRTGQTVGVRFVAQNAWLVPDGPVRSTTAPAAAPTS
ncbi:ABC transporter ATP-binding protein [Streptomyces sp. NPDC056188]|uniref:ABC transporter ATP-binding protein n=1 Tax=Streptomyces sp. NPDC056188 TaxID=3345740 RepID=UPI0035D84ECD